MEPKHRGTAWKELLTTHIIQLTNMDQDLNKEPREQTNYSHSSPLFQSSQNPTRSQRARMSADEALVGHRTGCRKDRIDLEVQTEDFHLWRKGG